MAAFLVKVPLTGGENAGSDIQTSNEWSFFQPVIAHCEKVSFRLLPLIDQPGYIPVNCEHKLVAVSSNGPKGDCNNSLPPAGQDISRTRENREQSTF